MKSKIIMLCALGLCMGLPLGTIYADPILRLDDGVNPVVTLDGLGSGQVTYNGALGNWDVNVTTGITKPVPGAADDPRMDLNSVNLASSLGGTLTTTWFDSGFTASVLDIRNIC